MSGGGGGGGGGGDVHRHRPQRAGRCAILACSVHDHFMASVIMMAVMMVFVMVILMDHSGASGPEQTHIQYSFRASFLSVQPGRGICAYAAQICAV
jgi:hypothetical protein